MASFFSQLRYSYGNEDWQTEKEALDVKPDDVILCITASGDRPLNLLTRECQKMVCVDANRIQNHLLELKAAAMAVLDFKTYIGFIGAVPYRNRKELLRTILPHLSTQAARFWSENLKMVEKGILYQGGVERLTGIAARAFSVLRGAKIKKLFAMENIEEQREFVQKEWDSFLWRKIFDVLLNPFISRFFIKDPGLANIGSNIKAGSYIYQRIHASLERELAKKNPLLSLILQGKVAEEAFSPYLTEWGTNRIKHRLSRLEVRTADILDYMETLPGPSFDVFSLSDIASYLSYPNYVRLLTLMIKTAKPGARFCMRQFLSSYEIPTHLKSYFYRDHALEKRLTEQDNCFVYRFMVGTIDPREAAENIAANEPHEFFTARASIR